MPLGELDIVALDRSDGRRTAVFCEVKCRTGLGYGDPLEAITYAKVRRLRQLAAEWMASTRCRSTASGSTPSACCCCAARSRCCVHVTGIGDR